MLIWLYRTEWSILFKERIYRIKEISCTVESLRSTGFRSIRVSIPLSRQWIRSLWISSSRVFVTTVEHFPSSLAVRISRTALSTKSSISSFETDMLWGCYTWNSIGDLFLFKKRVWVRNAYGWQPRTACTGFARGNPPAKWIPRDPPIGPRLVVRSTLERMKISYYYK